MRWPDVAAVARALGAEIGAEVRAHQAVTPLARAGLTAGEGARFGVLPAAGPRRSEWLRGRRALRGLGVADTAAIVFPHPALSLSHGRGVALAVRCGGVAGVGVDLEAWRPGLDPRAARFFLSPPEREGLDGRELVRRWAVKEALFKATPANHTLSLLDVSLTDPPAATGWARGPAGRLHYASRATAAGAVAVAVLFHEEVP